MLPSAGYRMLLYVVSISGCIQLRDLKLRSWRAAVLQVLDVSLLQHT